MRTGRGDGLMLRSGAEVERALDKATTVQLLGQKA